MREISIFTEKEHYAPGESVDGHILIRTDKEFNCNRIVLQAQGKEYTHYQAGKAHVSETHIVLSHQCIAVSMALFNTVFKLSWKLTDQ